MIHAIFFAHFHPSYGPRVVHQYPSGSITPEADEQFALPRPLLEFDLISDFIIPNQTLCGKYMSVTTPSSTEPGKRYRVMGNPMRIGADREGIRRYPRNEYIFNFCLVVGETDEVSAYMSIVRKLGRLFAQLEIENAFLSRRAGIAVGHEKKTGEEMDVGWDGIYAVIMQIMEDLNWFGECMIPIDTSNSVNLKLFSKQPPPPAVKPYHVPARLVPFATVDSTWDLTMQRILPFINGINTVSRIAQLADADYILTKKCIEHLLYYKCVLLSDVFTFSSMWSPTPDIRLLLEDKEIARVALSYIPLAPSTGAVTLSDLFTLYASLRAGITVKEWYVAQEVYRKGVDVRRLITFGAIKRLIYKVRKYPVSESLVMSGERETVGPMDAYLLGKKCMDEVCEELKCKEETALEKLKEATEERVVVLY